MKKRVETVKRKSDLSSASKTTSSKKAALKETPESKPKTTSAAKSKSPTKKTAVSVPKSEKQSPASARKIVVVRGEKKVSKSARAEVAEAPENTEKKLRSVRAKRSAAVSVKDSSEETSPKPRKRVLTKAVSASPAEKPKRIIRVIKAQKTMEKQIAISEESTSLPKRKTLSGRKTEATVEKTPKTKTLSLSKTSETKKPRAKRVTLKKLLTEISAKAAVPKKAAAVEPEIEQSPIFKELAEPKLPKLPSEDRARLQLQSPKRIFFYWSLRGNPFETLKKIFGARAERYSLTAKLVDLDSRKELILPVEPQGSFWFDVNSDTEYRAEIGFLSKGGSFVRLIYSNSLRTPRISPSPYRDFSEKFHITTEKFAEILDFSGFSQDAVAVSRADDETTRRRIDTRIRELVFGDRAAELSRTEEAELYFAIMSLASGTPMSELRKRISQRIFEFVSAVFEKRAKDLEATGLKILFGEEFENEEKFSPAVYGASLINFPKWKKRREKVFPISSPRSFAKK